MLKGVYRPDPSWLQFRRRFDKLQPFCRIAFHTSDKVRAVLATLEQVYQPLFPHLNMRQGRAESMAGSQIPSSTRLTQAVSRWRIHEASDGGSGMKDDSHKEGQVG